jgi:DNA polymerase-4
LVQHFGSFGVELYQLSRGIDERMVNPNRIAKSVSAEHTFIQDLLTLADCLAQLPNVYTRLQQRLSRYNDRSIKTQFVKLKFQDFTQTTIERASHELNFELFVSLCQQAYARKPVPVRLIGLGVDFTERSTNCVQLTLF